jgi:two-component system, NtrC family, sensor kinase
MAAPPWLDPGRAFRRLSIRNKLLAMVLLPLVVVLPLLGLLLLVWSNEAFDRLLNTKIRADLAVAKGYFERVLGEVGAGTAAVADSQRLHAALASARQGDWPEVLDRFRVAAGLDFINLRGPDGALLHRSGGLVSADEARAAPPVQPAPAVRVGNEPGAHLQVLSAEQLAALAPALRGRVSVPLLNTRNAAPTQRSVEDRALVLLSTSPVFSPDGRLIGHVQGGLLLNRNLAFIDHLNGIVYPDGSLPFGSRGTATLFLDDVRISTNVRLFADAPPATAVPGAAGASTGTNRAIGTRVSQTVREAVLGRGSTWLDRAFVVNEWYVSGYEPLRDRQGQSVGMLYVGFLERPFTLLKYGVLAGIGLIFFAVMIGATVVSLRWARAIFRPLEQMEATMQQVEYGDSAARVGTVGAPDALDEIGRLAGHLDHLLGVIDDKQRALQRWNAELDAKVAERTLQLEDAQSQLVKSEKLAAVGQLTASIAHEVNNPIAVIQGNLDLVRELLGPQGSALVRDELDLVDKQIERMRLIVNQLLQFARPNEFAGYVEAVDTERALDDCLVLVGHLLASTRITVQRERGATRTAAINRQELQQVLVNLMVNAIHAMPGGGILTLRTRDADDAMVEVSVADTGTGLPPDLLAELFQPFVTRKQGGTGLGLWISRSLVERHGGDILAGHAPPVAGRTGPAGGALFTVRLRSDLP